MKTHIVIHHSLTKDGDTVSWGAIRRYHTQTNGWLDIGYHAGIELVGEYYEIIMGRLPDRIGAHCREAGMNRVGIGLCLVGNFDEVAPPDEQLKKAGDLVRYWQRIFHIPRENVIGHRDAGLMAGFDWKKHQYKTCPGTLFPMDQFRESLLR